MKLKLPKGKYLVIGIAIVLIVGGFWWYKSNSNKSVTKQVTEKVQKGTIIQSVTGSGSVIAKIQSNPTVSGKARVEKLLVKDGDEVTEDQALLIVKSLATEEEIAKSYATLLSSQNSVLSAQLQYQEAQRNLNITNTTLSSSELAYEKAKIDAKKTINDAHVGVVNAFSTQDQADTNLEVLIAQLGSKGADLTMKASLLSAKANLKTSDSSLQQAKSNAESAISKTTIAKQSLAVAAANLKQSQLAYKSLTDQTITSPASGTIMGLSLIEGSVIGSSGSSTSSSSGGSTSTSTTTSSTSLFSIVNLQSLRAQVSINEVDVPSIKIGQATTMTFDSIEGKTLTGKVSSIDKLGVTTSGVTTYTAEIAFDVIDDAINSNILPGMSVTANIITTQKDNALLVTSTAISTDGDNQIVNVVKKGATSAVVVTTGISNDTQTEILSGLIEGDEVVTSTTTSSNTGTFSSSSSSSTRGSSAGGGSSLLGGGPPQGGGMPPQ